MRIAPNVNKMADTEKGVAVSDRETRSSRKEKEPLQDERANLSRHSSSESEDDDEPDSDSSSDIGMRRCTECKHPYTITCTMTTFDHYRALRMGTAADSGGERPESAVSEASGGRLFRTCGKEKSYS